MKYVLDTNVVSRVLDGDERVLGPLAAVEPHDVGIPLLVLADLLFRAEKSGRREENRRRVQVVTEHGRYAVQASCFISWPSLTAPISRRWGMRSS